MDLADPNTSLLREVDPSASVLGLTPIAVLVLRVPVGFQVAHGDGNGVDPVGDPPAEELIGQVQPVQVVELQGSHQLPSAASDPRNGDPPEQDVQQHPQDAHQEQHQQSHCCSWSYHLVHQHQMIPYGIYQTLRGQI